MAYNRQEALPLGSHSHFSKPRDATQQGDKSCIYIVAQQPLCVVDVSLSAFSYVVIHIGNSTYIHIAVAVYAMSIPTGGRGRGGRGYRIYIKRPRDISLHIFNFDRLLVVSYIVVVS